MEYIFLGRTGLKVSRLCLGTMNFGPLTDEKDAFRIMDAAIDVGVNFFDTANVYGWDRKGWTEEIIGRWFALGGGRREKVVLATKVYAQMNDSNDVPVDDKGLSAHKIRRHLESSLRRLQTDHVELYQMHHVDERTSWDELWGIFEILAQQGKVTYIGSSNFAGWHLVKAQAAAKTRNFLGLVTEQHKYNLTCRLPELEVLPAAMDLGIGIIPWSPLAGGLLGDNSLNPEKGSRSIELKEQTQKYEAQLKEFAKLCNDLGEKESNV